VSKKKSIKDRIQKTAINKKISCPELRKIAEELGISYGEAGKTANDLRIKIKNCDLGCF
jgi:LAO/AO transport system kinase